MSSMARSATAKPKKTSISSSAPRNCDVRPIWEPPVFSYSDILDDEYLKIREAVLIYTSHNVVETTEIMDKLIDMQLMETYSNWALDTGQTAEDEACRKFAMDLRSELEKEYNDNLAAFRELEVILESNDEDGTWVAMSYEEFKRVHPEMVGSDDDDDVEDITSTELQTMSGVVSSSSTYPQITDDSNQGSNALQDPELNEDITLSTTHISGSNGPISYQQLQSGPLRTKNLLLDRKIQTAGMIQNFQKSKTWSATPLALRLMSVELEAGEEAPGSDACDEVD